MIDKPPETKEDCDTAIGELKDMRKDIKSQKDQIMFLIYGLGLGLVFSILSTYFYQEILMNFEYTNVIIVITAGVTIYFLRGITNQFQKSNDFVKETDLIIKGLEHLKFNLPAKKK